jgi:hypothetical protein
MSQTNNHIETIPYEEVGLPAIHQLPLVDQSDDKAFINANTIASSIQEIRKSHIIPVFVKDNETLISHTDFIECTQDLVGSIFQGERILMPSIRLSHPIKGRIPEAKDRSAHELMEHEKTIYYERMAFVIEIPTISDVIDGNMLSLTVGGVKAYNLDNLYNKKGTDEHFKVFIGFQNKVCTNLCVWTDGYMADLKVQSIHQLKASIRTLIESYNQSYHLFHLKRLTNYSITEHQFAHLIGRCRMYNHLPNNVKSGMKPIFLGDTQIGSVVRDYYKDDSFCKMADGSINLWRLYNLFTGTNKSSYIDTFLDRSVNAFEFTEQLRHSLENHTTSWFLN